MRHPRAVVTGGSGFLGSHLCEALLAEGVSVLCLDNLLTGTSRNIAHLAERRDFRFLKRDLTEPVNVPGDVGYVFHLAEGARRHPGRVRGRRGRADRAGLRRDGRRV
ncbi:NAD-dependent epimerase/dehydratase family protein, partial [Actinomadura sp. NPDC048032]|uniref:NAD-dependent epimerase/dehydratase family protein n=1 Tax=Actinomadura sp. NPDC048032 TaxID=3155747 RepID=UPI0033F5D36C